MPVMIMDNTLYKIQDLRVEFDKLGPVLTVNAKKATACVICVSKGGPVAREDLCLDDRELRQLLNGATLDFSDRDHTLQGITRQQLAAAPQFRNFKLEPPAHVQAWGLVTSGNGEITLYLPEDIREQCILVPVTYQVQVEEGSLQVDLPKLVDYKDGDLMYSVDGRLPIPIPASGLNRRIQLRPGAVPVVIPKPECAEKYVRK